MRENVAPAARGFAFVMASRSDPGVYTALLLQFDFSASQLAQCCQPFRALHFLTRLTPPFSAKHTELVHYRTNARLGFFSVS
jgi:hypothetical protein